MLVEISYRGRCTSAELLHEIIRSFVCPSFFRTLVSVTDENNPPPMQPSVQHEGTFSRRDRRVSVVHSPTGGKRLPKESIDLWLVGIFTRLFVRRRFTSHVQLP